MTETKEDLLVSLWNRQNGTCIYCDEKFDYLKKKPTFDHIVPGGWGEFNIVLACQWCNGIKSDFILWSWSVSDVSKRFCQSEELIYRSLLLQLNVLRRMSEVFLYE
jgi:hypothetical protein